MSEPRKTIGSMHFGPFELSTESSELRKHGQRLKLSGQAIDVLLMLASNAGRLVTREELQRKLWPGDSFGDFEHGLNAAVNRLREALGDSAADPTYIETVPRRGYRFIARVNEVSQAAGIGLAPAHTRNGSKWLGVIKGHRLGVAVGLIVVGFVIGVVFYSTHSLYSGRVSQAKITHKQFTFFGNANWPAISPDGTFVAYVAKKPGTEQKLIVQANNGSTLELARGTEISRPRWSPDGSEILFSRYEPTTSDAYPSGIFLVSRIGGAARLIKRGEYACWLSGSQIVTARQSGGPKGLNGVILVDKFTGEAREVHVSEYKLLRDIDCSLRAGLILAVTQGAEKVQLRIFKSDGSEQRTLVAEGDEIYSARWSASGDSIYYLHGRGSTSELSQFPVTGRHGEPTAIAGGLQTGTFFTISADDARLAYTREDDNSNLWRVNLPTAGTKPRPKISRLTSGTSHYGAPSFSPDGHWIAFPLGPKRDETNIFKMQVTGGEPVQLTFFEHAETNSPAWSPDGQRIAFISDQNGSPKVWITNADGGTPQRLENTNASDTNGRLSWWPSREIFYQKAGCRNYLRLDDKTQTEGTVIQQDESVGWVPWRPVFSPDGKQIAFQWNRQDRGLWIISLKPYFETFMIVGGIYPFGWSPDGKYVYAIPRAGQQAVRIRVAAPHEITSVAILPSDSVDFDSASMSPDGREFVVSIYEKKSDVWVMENFNSSALGTSTQ